MAEAGQNRVLGELLRKLRERTAMLFSPNDPVRQARSWNEHAAILRAIIEGDERAAATLAAEHVTARERISCSGSMRSRRALCFRPRPNAAPSCVRGSQECH